MGDLFFLGPAGHEVFFWRDTKDLRYDTLVVSMMTRGVLNKDGKEGGVWGFDAMGI